MQSGVKYYNSKNTYQRPAGKVINYQQNDPAKENQAIRIEENGVNWTNNRYERNYQTPKK